MLRNTKKPWIMAHRAGGGEAKENSFSAFQNCIEYNIKLVETDAWLGYDGQIYLLHGRLLDTFKSTSIKQKVVGSAPLLSDVLAMYPNLFISIDPKHPAVIQPLFDLIMKHNAFERVCFSPSFYWRARKLNDIAKSQNVEIMTSLSAWSIISNLLPAIIFKPRILRSTVIAYPTKLLARKWVVNLAHKHNIYVIVQNVSVKEISHLSSRGVDGFMTDYPVKLTKLLHE